MDRPEMNGNVRVPKRILNTLLASLAAGVVPRAGAPYIAIGRKNEIVSLLTALSDVEVGGASVRFVIGRYGSGKSFLLQLVRGYALDRGFITADADLSPERRLCGGGGCGLATYRELIRNLASKTSPDGGALPTVLARHYETLKAEIAADGISPDTEEFSAVLRRRVYGILSSLEGSVGGFDFARVLGEYYAASLSDNTERRTAALRWLRGEYANKTEAKRELGFSVSLVIDDDNWYNFIKLWAEFARLVGYAGLIVFVDECVNLYKINNRASRESNYEKLLAIFNDTLQGRATGLGFVFGGTPQFLEDTRRGLFGYEALRSRLCDSRFSDPSYLNTASPIIRLRRLSDDELLALIARLTDLHAMQGGHSNILTDSEMTEFLRGALARAGSEEMVTPREIIRDYLTLLNILRENPELDAKKLIGAAEKNEVPAPETPQSKEKVQPFGLADIEF